MSVMHTFIAASDLSFSLSLSQIYAVFECRRKDSRFWTGDSSPSSDHSLYSKASPNQYPDNPFYQNQSNNSLSNADIAARGDAAVQHLLEVAFKLSVLEAMEWCKEGAHKGAALVSLILCEFARTLLADFARGRRWTAHWLTIFFF
jgi:hypothetical protein